ncbi:MAG: hypothetical protein KAR87_06370 [Candidatus Aenigmarchaeota archaeon]|nr:hypothetical protein [Candidatus Aenigmarchaeota archaeon]
MLSKIIFTVIALLFMLNMAHATEEYNLSVDIDIEPYVYKDANVAGDSFYYRIMLTNNMSYNESYNVSDIFTVSVYNPKGELIEKPRIYNRTINLNETIKIIAKGGLGTETAAFPFDISGDYKIILNSTNNYINYYRWLNDDRWLRMPNRFNYYFDVMPKWQYDLWKEEQDFINKSYEITGQNLDINIENRNLAQEMKEGTDKMYNVTEDMREATIVMKWVSILTFFVALTSLFVSFVFLLKKCEKFDNNSATKQNNSKIEENADPAIDGSKSATNTKDSPRTDNTNSHLKKEIKEEFEVNKSN